MTFEKMQDEESLLFSLDPGPKFWIISDWLGTLFSPKNGLLPFSWAPKGENGAMKVFFKQQKHWSTIGYYEVFLFKTKVVFNENQSFK